MTLSEASHDKFSFMRPTVSEKCQQIEDLKGWSNMLDMR